jgi:hypothetical protein
MKELGQVTALKRDKAVVRIERLLTTGGGCCCAESWETVYLEARNKCGAGIDDYVNIISDYDRLKFREIVKLLACAGAFTVSLGIGNYLWPALGIGAWKDPLSFGLGGVLALAVFALIGIAYRKQPVFIPGAYEVVPPDRAVRLIRQISPQETAAGTTEAAAGAPKAAL